MEKAPNPGGSTTLMRSMKEWPKFKLFKRLSLDKIMITSAMQSGLSLLESVQFKNPQPEWSKPQKTAFYWTDPRAIEEYYQAVFSTAELTQCGLSLDIPQWQYNTQWWAKCIRLSKWDWIEQCCKCSFCVAICHVCIVQWVGIHATQVASYTCGEFSLLSTCDFHRLSSP